MHSRNTAHITLFLLLFLLNLFDFILLSRFFSLSRQFEPSCRASAMRFQMIYWNERALIDFHPFEWSKNETKYTRTHMDIIVLVHSVIIKHRYISLLQA